MFYRVCLGICLFCFLLSSFSVYNLEERNMVVSFLLDSFFFFFVFFPYFWCSLLWWAEARCLGPCIEFGNTNCFLE